MQVSELWIYPIKSCRGIPVERFELDDRGPVRDRRFMLVDSSNEFITARTHHRLVLVSVEIDGDELVVEAPGVGASRFHAEMRESGDAEECVIWHDRVLLTNSHVNDFFSSFLGEAVRLMYMPTTSMRVVDRVYSAESRLVSLADAFPMLLIGQGSLDHLNERLTAQGLDAVPMRRFRPNVVVSGTQAHEEDGWQTIQIGTGEYDVVKPCSRCVLTTVDPDTGVMGKEPLRTLSQYRKRGSNVYFGQNVIHQSSGPIRIGDAVTVVDVA